MVSTISAHVPGTGTQACGPSLTAGESGKCGFPTHPGRSPVDEPSSSVTQLITNWPSS